MTEAGEIQSQNRELLRPDGRIAYDRWGETGPWVICAPGMGDLRSEYRFLAPILVRAGFRVATMDLRGMGRSTTGFASYSPEAVGSDLVALARELEPTGRVHLIGTSMAAAAAVWAAAEQPSSVGGLVLIGPFVRDVPVSMGTRLLLRVAFVRPWGVQAWVRYYATLYPLRLPPDFPDYRERLRKNLAEPRRLKVLRSMLFSSKAECERRVGEVRAPVLVAMGSKDPDFPEPAAEARTVAERLNGTVAMIEGAGHYPQAETPELVGPAIVDFLRHARSD